MLHGELILRTLFINIKNIRIGAIEYSGYATAELPRCQQRCSSLIVEYALSKGDMRIRSPFVIRSHDARQVTPICTETAPQNGTTERTPSSLCFGGVVQFLISLILLALGGFSH
ncbi:MAG: hypothetical protein KFH87_07105 [Bacteroidetes bacterium]|nr:hypothetical protein [Bacteroidota bacterium]